MLGFHLKGDILGLLLHIVSDQRLDDSQVNTTGGFVLRLH